MKYEGMSIDEERFEIYRDGDPLSMVEIISDLNDLQHENDRLKQRLANLRDKTIRFAEKEMRD